MNLLRINKEHVVNLDLVTRIQTEKSKAVINFGSGTAGDAESVTLEGPTAERFLTYIEAKLCDSLMP